MRAGLDEARRADLLEVFELDPTKRGRTYSGYAILRLAPDLHDLILSPFRKPASRKIAESVQAGG